MGKIRIDTEHVAHLLSQVVSKALGITQQYRSKPYIVFPTDAYKKDLAAMTEAQTAEFLVHRLPEPVQSSNANFPVRIAQGATEVTYIHGKVTPDWFQIYVGLSGDKCWVENSCEGAATNVLVYPDGSKVWDPNTGTYIYNFVAGTQATVIDLPENWQIGLSENKGVLRIIGVRYPEDTADISQSVPFTVVDPAALGY